MIGVGEFFKGALYNMAGYDPVRAIGEPRGTNWTGWGQFRTSTSAASMASTASEKIGTHGWLWGKAGAGPLARTGKTVAQAGARGALSSGLLGPGVTALSMYWGYQDEGWWGAAKWGVAEVFLSGIFAGVMSGAIGGGGIGATAVGAGLGSLAGPGGMVVGAGLGATAGFGGLALGGMALAGVATGVGATYLAAKGSYELLKAGYRYRQRMMHKIDTAGSTAAFMTKNAFTDRSKAIAAIQNNQLNVKSAFGNEATRVHFSSYRKWGSNRYY